MSKSEENKFLLFSNSEDKLMYKKDEIIEGVEKAESMINNLFSKYPYLTFRFKKIKQNKENNKIIIPENKKKLFDRRVSMTYKELIQERKKNNLQLKKENKFLISLKKINYKGRNNIFDDNKQNIYSIFSKSNTSLEELGNRNNCFSQNNKIILNHHSQKENENYFNNLNENNKSNDLKENEIKLNKEEITNSIYQETNFSFTKQINNQCDMNLFNGEKLKKLIQRQKNKSVELKKKNNRIYKNNLKRIEDQILIDNENLKKFTKGMMKKLIGKKSLKKNLILHKKELNKLKIDVIPKINENLAYNHRDFYMRIFDYDYQNDNDFLFIKDFLKAKRKQFKNILSVTKFNSHFNSKNNQIEEMLDQDIKDKNNLMNRLKNDKEKYNTDGHFILNNKAIKNEIEKDSIKFKLSKKIPKLNINKKCLINKNILNKSDNKIDNKNSYEDFKEFKIEFSHENLLPKKMK